MIKVNHFSVLRFDPLDDGKRVFLSLVRSSIPNKITTVQQFKRFVNSFFRIKLHRVLEDEPYFVIYDGDSRQFILCRFLIVSGVLDVLSIASLDGRRFDFGILLNKYMYWMRCVEKFSSWDDITKWIYDRYYTGRFNEDLFVRLNAKDLVLDNSLMPL